MPISDVVWITPEPDDIYDSFGSSVAINNKYLAVSDFIANRVVIYTHNHSGQWSRSKILLPPTDSIPDQIGYGFGKELQLEGDFLIISASVEKNIKNVTNLKGFQRITNSVCYFAERYLINLATETELKPIGLPIEKTSRLVKFNLFSEGKIRQVKLPNRRGKSFGASFAYHKNLLLVGSPSHSKGETTAWLYDIDRLDGEPEKLTIPGVYTEKTVALNDQFAAVSQIGDSSGTLRLYPQHMSNKPKKTLIKSLKNDSTTIHSGIGKLSLSNNILARMRPLSPHLDCRGFLEVFYLDENAVPKLILTQESVVNAFVQNGFLIIVVNDYKSGFKVSVQSIV